MEVHWDNCSFDLIFCICMCITVLITLLIVCLCVRIILEHKKKIVEMNLSHEKEMKEKEWERKEEWEKYITERNNSQKKSEAEKENEAKEGKIKELEGQLEKTTQLDLERIALLVYFSSNNRGYWTPEKADKLIGEVTHTQEAIKKYLEFKS